MPEKTKNQSQLMIKDTNKNSNFAPVINQVEYTEILHMGVSPCNLWDMKRYYMHYYQLDTKLRQAVAVLRIRKTSTVKESLPVQKEGHRSVKRKIEYYN